jgi:hypothetical protein
MPAVTRYWWETCRPAVTANPVPNRTIRAIVAVRLVRAVALPVVAAAMSSVSSVLAFTSVPVAEPKGVR